MYIQIYRYLSLPCAQTKRTAKLNEIKWQKKKAEFHGDNGPKEASTDIYLRFLRDRLSNRLKFGVRFSSELFSKILSSWRCRSDRIRHHLNGQTVGLDLRVSSLERTLKLLQKRTARVTANDIFWIIN